MGTFKLNDSVLAAGDAPDLAGPLLTRLTIMICLTRTGTTILQVDSDSHRDYHHDGSQFFSLRYTMHRLPGMS